MPSLTIPVMTCVLCAAATVNKAFVTTMNIFLVLCLVNMFRREQHDVDQVFLFLLPRSLLCTRLRRMKYSCLYTYCMSASF